MRSHQPVRRCAADEEAAGEKPEVGAAHTDHEAVDRRAKWIARPGGGGGLVAGGSERPQPHVGRIVSHQQGNDGDGGQRGADHDPRSPPPAVADRERGEDRKKDQLPGGAGGR